MKVFYRTNIVDVLFRITHSILWRTEHVKLQSLVCVFDQRSRTNGELFPCLRVLNKGTEKRKKEAIVIE